MKSRPGKVMENENLAKSHGKVMEFDFSQIYLSFLFRKMCWLRTLLTQNDTE